MKLLSYDDVIQVSGGRKPTEQEVLASLEHYSFFGALVGGSISGVYGLCTNHAVTTTVGTVMTTVSSFTNVFWVGLGVSWVLGAALGVGVAVYNAEFSGKN